MRISGLSTLIRLLRSLCRISREYGPIIRPFVPEDKRDEFDDALAGIFAACAVIEAISFLDNEPGTLAPWGS